MEKSKNTNGKLYVLIGVPGSGKSTWADAHRAPSHEVVVSRDKIRFSIIEEDEEYFSHEDEVYKEFVHEIDKWLTRRVNVYADATHLNPASRRKLLNSLKVKPSAIECIWMRTPLEEALNRNENRKGTRSYVPRGVIRRMYNSMTAPSFEEGFSKMYVVTPDKPIEIREEM